MVILEEMFSNFENIDKNIVDIVENVIGINIIIEELILIMDEVNLGIG